MNMILKCLNLQTCHVGAYFQTFEHRKEATVSIIFMWCDSWTAMIVQIAWLKAEYEPAHEIMVLIT